MKIKLSHPSEDEIKNLNLDRWSEWRCEPSEFDWYYDTNETCYFYEGEVIVKTEWEEVKIKPGDLVTFPKGLSCIWKVLKPVRKVYRFD
ncbi:MAG: cupin domain-containing protein [bacterium]